LGKDVGLQAFTARKLDIKKILLMGDNCIPNFGGDNSGEVPWKTVKARKERHRMDSKLMIVLLYVMKWKAA
jgi:hypothetical protein